jgi:hypothetical protein
MADLVYRGHRIYPLHVLQDDRQNAEDAEGKQHVL